MFAVGMISSHMNSENFSKWPHGRTAISCTVVALLNIIPPIELFSAGVWSPQPHGLLWSYRRQQTAISALQTWAFQTKGAGQKERGGPDHLTLHPPDGLTRHNNITPKSTWVKQVQACLSDPEIPEVNGRRRLTAELRCFCKQHWGGDWSWRDFCCSSDRLWHYKEVGDLLLMFVTQFHGFILSWRLTTERNRVSCWGWRGAFLCLPWILEFDQTRLKEETDSGTVHSNPVISCWLSNMWFCDESTWTTVLKQSKHTVGGRVKEFDPFG